MHRRGFDMKRVATRRLLLIATIAAISLTWLPGPTVQHTASARAAPKPSHAAGVFQVPARMGLRALSPLSRADRPRMVYKGTTWLPMQVGSSGMVKSSEQMELPRSAFPGSFRLVQSYSITAADADGKALSQLHSTSYTDLGMQGGWWQYYTYDLPDGLFDIVYQGSYYNDAGSVSGAFDDVAITLALLPDSSVCSVGDRCFEAPVPISFPDGQYMGVVRAVQMSNGLAEFSVAVPAADYSADQSTMNAYLDTATNAFLGVASPAIPTVTPTSTTIPATATATPTSTPIPATATATATPKPRSTHKSTKTQRPCRKGFKRVHGKCKKTKKRA
jgi:hypothetical protein